MLIKVSEMRKHPELEFIFERPNLNFWLGPHMHCVVYLLNGGEICNVVVLCPDNLPPDVNIQPATPEELRSLFEGWDPAFQKLVELVESTAKWRLQNSRELESWVHPTGNFILLGDACHATLPYLAQGAAQAVEDGAVLASLLVKLEDKSQLHDMLKIYEGLRKSRTTRVVQGSSYIGQKVFHLVDGPEQEQRDKDLQKPPFVGYPNRWSDPVFQKFLFKYDPEEEADRGLADFQAANHVKGYMEDEIVTPRL
jgi:salicylate hydroxylase